MNAWMLCGTLAFGRLASTGLFFFVVTRGALVLPRRCLHPASRLDREEGL